MKIKLDFKSVEEISNYVEMHTFPAIGGSQADDVSAGPRHLGLGGGELAETMLNRNATCLSADLRFNFFPM